MNKEEKEELGFFAFCAGAVLTGLCLVIGLIFGIAALHSMYSVWSARNDGKAIIAKAEYDRQVKTLEAKAAEESAKHLAEAEVIRAEGVARANQIIGDSLTGNEAYLRYLYIDGLKNSSGQIIYVPTEGCLPLLEANRLK